MKPTGPLGEAQKPAVSEPCPIEVQNVVESTTTAWFSRERPARMPLTWVMISANEPSSVEDDAEVVGVVLYAATAFRAV